LASTNFHDSINGRVVVDSTGSGAPYLTTRLGFLNPGKCQGKFVAGFWSVGATKKLANKKERKISVV
jgi:hypothetical protein